MDMDKAFEALTRPSRTANIEWEEDMWGAINESSTPTKTWPCQQCGATVERYRGSSEVTCARCGAEYNASGQRLRDDWRGNPSTWDSEIGDMEGYEIQHARQSARRRRPLAALASKIQVGRQDAPALKTLSRLRGPRDKVGSLTGEQIIRHLLAVGQMDPATRRALSASLRTTASSATDEVISLLRSNDNYRNMAVRAVRSGGLPANVLRRVAEDVWASDAHAPLSGTDLGAVDWDTVAAFVHEQRDTSGLPFYARRRTATATRKEAKDAHGYDWEHGDWALFTNWNDAKGIVRVVNNKSTAWVGGPRDSHVDVAFNQPAWDLGAGMSPPQGTPVERHRLSPLPPGTTPSYREATRKQAAVGDQCWSCGGKGWYSTVSYDYDPYEGQRMEITCSTCGGSGVVNEPTDYPLADDPIFTDRYSSRKTSILAEDKFGPDDYPLVMVEHAGADVPVIAEAPGAVVGDEADVWRPATDAEYQRYLDYYRTHDASRRTATWESGYYGKYITDECMDNGVGCDGWTTEGDQCDCGCHEASGLQTNEDVAAWHADDPNGYTREIGEKISRKTASARPLHRIASEIQADWKRVDPAALPYLDAMSVLGSVNESYGAESGRNIVRHFVAASDGWRSRRASQIKRELMSLAARPDLAPDGAPWPTDPDLAMDLAERDEARRNPNPRQTTDRERDEAWNDLDDLDYRSRTRSPSNAAGRARAQAARTSRKG